MRQTQALQKVHTEAKAEFDRSQSALRDERKQCLEDRRFVSIPGAMWEGPLGDMFENKPKLEINKIMLSLIRIYNEYRNNRITVDFVSKDGRDAGGLADICDGLYRADEQDSTATEAYDNAFDEGTSGGYGAWRLRAEYEDEDDDENTYQRIRMEPIYDADTSVYFDLDAKKQDKSDAKRGWIVSSMSVEGYKAEYGDDPTSWPKETDSKQFDWCTPDVVYIAEYYEVEKVKETVYTYITATGDKLTLTDDDLEEQDLTGAVMLSEKKVTRRKVHKYIMSGGGILEDCGFIAGKYIPIIPFYGKRWYVDNVERCMGHVRLAKDPARLKNMQVSKLAETAALSAVQKPIVHPEQIAGHEVRWSEDNVKNYPYLLINQLETADGQTQPAGPIAYTKAPEIPPALAASLQVSEQDQAEILGRQEQGEQMLANQSGKAVELIQQSLGMQSFIYMSNFAKSMQWCGKVWLSMAKEVYTEDERSMKMIGEMGNTETTDLMVPALDEETGEPTTKNDLSKANFDIAVDVGPSSSSRRDATVSALTNMMQMTSDPEDIKILQAMALMNMDGEGLSDLNEFYRKQLVQKGVLQPNEEEQEAMAEAAENPPPDPNSEFLLAEAEKSKAQAEESKSKTAVNYANVDKTVAETGKTDAETIKIMEEAAEPPAV